MIGQQPAGVWHWTGQETATDGPTVAVVLRDGKDGACRVERLPEF